MKIKHLAVLIASGLTVIAIVLAMAFAGGENKPTNTTSHTELSITDSSSEDSSVDTSSEDSSETSSEESSKETSSKETSSKVTSSKETSSKETSSKETSSKNNEPTYDGTISVAKIDTSKMQALYKRNKDTIGWIKIPNTNIDYGVVQENYYGEYDKLDYDKKVYYFPNGRYYGDTIWADYDANFGTRDQLVKNTIIYGHNWTNVRRPLNVGRAKDTHFAQLAAYDYINFARSNPYISFSTLEEEMYWQIFAVFYTDIDFNYIDANPVNLTTITDEAMKRSMYDFGVTVTDNDKILTLSTCTRVYENEAKKAGKPVDYQRFVVMAKLMPKGAELTPMNITENKDFKKPQF